MFQRVSSQFCFQFDNEVLLFYNYLAQNKLTLFIATHMTPIPTNNIQQSKKYNHMQDRKNIIYIVMGTAALGCGYYFYRQLQAQTQLQRQIDKCEVKRWNEIAGKLKGLSGNVVLLKDSFHKESTVKYNLQIPVYSNSVLFNMFPISEYRSHLLFLYRQSEGIQQVKFKDYPFRAKLPYLTNRNLVSIDRFKYTSIFEGKNEPGFFHKIFKYSMATISGFFNLIFQIFAAPEREKPILQGPLWGSLVLYSNLIFNTPLILLCQVEDGKLHPFIAGFNKRQILQLVQNKKQFLLFFLILNGFMAFYSFSRMSIRWIKQQFKSSMKSQIQIREGSEASELRSYSPNVQEDQQCIICYARCRNTILRKCKHMMLCWECADSAQNPIDSCPTCRVNCQGEFVRIMRMNQKQKFNTKFDLNQ